MGHLIYLSELALTWSNIASFVITLLTCQTIELTNKKLFWPKTFQNVDMGHLIYLSELTLTWSNITSFVITLLTQINIFSGLHTVPNPRKFLAYNSSLLNFYNHSCTVLSLFRLVILPNFEFSRVS